MAILVTGGAGFIGSHTVLSLIDHGYEVIILDNLSNASHESIYRLEQLAKKKISFYHGDIRDRSLLQKIFTQHPIETVMHFAGLKAVGESVRESLNYYNNNVLGSIILLEEMEKASIHRIVFSSSATVYGNPKQVPIHEKMSTGGTTNPYGTSKYMIERVLMDLQISRQNWGIIILRYFNPIGAHPSGLIGEDPNGIPNNLLPYICQVAVGKLERLSVFGDDYPTHDGTGVRDYIHVMDLALGHVKAMEKHLKQTGTHVYNLGTGIGYSVLDIVRAFEKASSTKIPYQIVPRRDGDIAICFADPNKAKIEIEWTAKHNLDDMMKDAWRWQKNNPNGYR